MKKNNIKETFVKELKEGLEEINQPINNIQVRKAKETVVKFDKSTSPFEVIFSERGFEINKTRFSFEFIETAISKNINITLDKGNGLVLDTIKMEKIIKYKDLYKS
jgi:hypothetical protein